MDGLPDHPLELAIARVRAGDREAFRDVVVACAPKVRLVVAAILPVRGEVDDVVQEVFLLAFDRLHAYAPGSDFIAWVKEIGRNLALNERRRVLRQDQARAALRERIERACAPHLLAHADEAAVDGLRDCLARLGATARAVVEQVYVQDRPAAEIAAAHARSASWVWVTVHRARQALAECLRGKGIFHG